MTMQRRAFLIACAACSAVAGAVTVLWPYRPAYIGPGDIVPMLSFYGVRQFGGEYSGPVAWVQMDDGWRPLTPAQLNALPYRVEAYPGILIEQVSAQAYFSEYGAWPEKPTDAQIMHLCQWQKRMGFSTVPCDELRSSLSASGS